MKRLLCRSPTWAPVPRGPEGFFKQEQLTIEPQVMQGGAEVTAAVVSGDVDLGFAATEPLIVAKSKGIPVEIVSQGNQAAAVCSMAVLRRRRSFGHRALARLPRRSDRAP